MTGVVFIIVFGASFVLFPCQGQITSPPDGTRLTFLCGSTANITWSFDDEISKVSFRSWYFTSSDGSINGEILGSIVGDGNFVAGQANGLSGVTIVKPASLILENVNQTYNGTYRFDLTAPVGGRSEVVVFIAITPNVTVNCSSLITLNASDYFACECKGEGGNPPADVTWYKGEEQKGDTGTEEAILRLTNINKNDNGTYTCVAKSHEKAKNVATIELLVNYPPENVKLMFIRSGKSTTIECSADAHPSPRFKIFVNETKLVKSDKMHTIPEVRSNHVGNYTCVAENILGNNSSGSEYLSPEGHPTTPTGARTTTTTSTSTSNTSKKPTTTNEGTGTEKAALEECNCSGTEWYIVVVALVSGIIIGLFLEYILLYVRRRWFRNKKPELNSGPQTTEVDTTYQELDLTKMNTEDNYQSLRVNAASNTANDDESTYTELNKGDRDGENNYQSLT